MLRLVPAERTDLEALAELLAEMDTFYGDETKDALDVRERQIEDALFGQTPAAHALLAWEDEQLVGLAAYSFLWPAVGLTRSLYLKELYVLERRRRAGIGNALMRALFDLARQHECSRVEWMTDQPNTSAQAFYTALGANVDGTKLFYRVSDPG